MATQFRMLEKPILHFTKGDTHCAAVVIDEEPGGSGTFVNLAVAFGNRKGSNLFLLGDRVAVTSIKIENGLLCVNYLDHANRQPLAERPTAPVTKYFTLNRETLEAARATKGE